MKDITSDELSQGTLAAVHTFNEAFFRQDIEATMAAMAEDCVFENTYPPPDGTRAEGQAAVRTVFETFFQGSPQARFEIEEIVPLGERCAVRWRYHWLDEAGQPGHIRGIDLFRVNQGKVVEKLSYVKG